MGSRRSNLASLEPAVSTHAGLWLDGWVPDLDGKGTGKQAHLDEAIARIRVPSPYAKHYQRWERLVAACPPHTALARATVQGRMVIGLGAESVLETAVALHRTYGVPYLPGPALKGLAAAAAHRHLEDEDGTWRKAGKDRPIGESHRAMFGAQEEGGHVTFHDALWIPEPGGRLPLDLDVMTVHHADYYMGKDVPPADWDNPNPVAFLTAHGSYLLALTGPRPWAEAALAILTGALAEDGIGAKTAAGYGRMSVVPAAAQTAPRPAAGAGERPAWEAAVRNVQPGNADHEVPKILAKLSGRERRLAAQEIVRRLERKTLKTPKWRDKEWVKLLLAATEEDRDA